MAEKTTFAGIKPTRLGPRSPHLVAVVAFDGVVLADLAAPLEVFGRLRDDEGNSLYEVRMAYVEVTNALARPPQPGPAAGTGTRGR